MMCAALTNQRTFVNSNTLRLQKGSEFGVLWRILVYIGVLWRIMVYIGVLWRIMVDTGLFSSSVPDQPHQNLP